MKNKSYIWIKLCLSVKEMKNKIKNGLKYVLFIIIIIKLKLIL